MNGLFYFNNINWEWREEFYSFRRCSLSSFYLTDRRANTATHNKCISEDFQCSILPINTCFPIVIVISVAPSSSKVNCQDCGKTYVSRTSLRRHRLFECPFTGPKILFKCDFCDFHSKRKDNLKYHMATHFKHGKKKRPFRPRRYNNAMPNNSLVILD